MTSVAALDTRIARFATLLFLCAALPAVFGCGGIASSASTPTSPSSSSTGSVSLAPSSVSFGAVPIGSSASQSLTIANTGPSSVTVRLESAVPAGFTLSGISGTTTIAGGGHSAVTVVFSPTSMGASSGILTLMDVAGTQLSSVAISGTGSAAVSALTASASSVTFFETGLGSSSTVALSLTNTRNATITILGVSVSGATFVANGVSQGTILAAGQTATLNVTFTPQSRGVVTGGLTIASDATNVPMVIPLAGPGYQPSSHSVTLSWAASTSNVSGYNVHRSTGTNGAFELLNAAVISGNSYTDATVESGQTYDYNVTSVGLDGAEGTPSAQISIAIPNP